ncbi:MAG TPA: site-specific integrase [Acidimicrobiales bacterium]|nr:site-specific integrase [Acidimicrobiales bacterium]
MTVTVNQLLDRWLEHIEPTHSPKTIREYRHKIQKHIRPAVGHLTLSALKPQVLDYWYRVWLDKGLSEATVHHLHAILSAVLHQAERWGWIESSPARRASPPPLRATPMNVPTPDQVDTLHRTAEEKDPVLATAIALAALTGARRGELCALRWSDVDLVNGTIRIARSVSVVDGKVREGPTKTHQVRTLALDKLGIHVLRVRRQYMTDLAERAESPLVDDPYVLSFNANGGRPVGPDTLTHRFSSLCALQEKPALERLRKTKRKATRKDLPEKDRWAFRFHDLRHFSATQLIASGVDIKTVSNRLGHSQATMTLDRYAKALPEKDREAAAVLGSTVRILGSQQNDGSRGSTLTLLPEESAG